MKLKHILLVDDEDDIREVAALSLETVGGWRVSSASDGSSGVLIARAEAPDAILLDVMMPGVDGPTTFERLQADPLTRDIPVILLTAKAQSADRRRFDQLGVAGTLTKPFDPMTLSDQITAILDRTKDTP
jgi:CheY-like chemotaxis protein